MNKKVTITTTVLILIILGLFFSLDWSYLDVINEQSRIGVIQREYDSSVPCKEWKEHYAHCINCLEEEASGLKKYYNLYCIDGCVKYCAEW